MSEDILVTRDLTKKYHKASVVDHVSMSVKRRDIYGFIGENGAGKTTFMRMVCGLAKPTSGELELYGVTGEKNLQKARKKMGVLIENPAVHPNMSAMEHLQVQRRYLGLSAKEFEHTAEALLELVGLADTGKKKTKEFSLGMKQRLGLAIALTGNPGFLILDEPTIGLDPAGKAELRSLLWKLNQEKGLTVFFSSHDLSEMQRLATRYGFLHRGKLIKELTAEELEQECSSRRIDVEQYSVDLILQLGKGERG